MKSDSDRTQNQASEEDILRSGIGIDIVGTLVISDWKCKWQGKSILKEIIKIYFAVPCPTHTRVPCANEQDLIFSQGWTQFHTVKKPGQPTQFQVQYFRVIIRASRLNLFYVHHCSNCLCLLCHWHVSNVNQCYIYLPCSRVVYF